MPRTYAEMLAEANAAVAETAAKIAADPQRPVYHLMTAPMRLAPKVAKDCAALEPAALERFLLAKSCFIGKIRYTRIDSASEHKRLILIGKECA